MSYTALTGLAIAAVVVLDTVVGGRVLRTRACWLSYAIILGFQLLVNGALTGFDIVRYDAAAITGVRVAYQPIEDIGFGFAMTVLTLTTWTRLRQLPSWKQCPNQAVSDKPAIATERPASP